MANSLVEVVNELIRSNPDKTQQARKNPQLSGWFIGQIMKATNGVYSSDAVAETLARRGIHSVSLSRHERQESSDG